MKLHQLHIALFQKTSTGFLPLRFLAFAGNVKLTAGQAYSQTASNVIAANDVNVTAQSIDLLAAQNTGDSYQTERDLKIGAFARVKSPIIDLINNIDAARKSDGRLQAMQGMAAVANGYQIASAAGLTGGKGGTLITAEVGVGFANANSSDKSSHSTAQGSSINGGRNVTLTSTEGNIHGVGANIAAGNALTLDSAQDIVLEAAQSETHSLSRHSNVGVGVSVGAQTGVYAYVQAQACQDQSASSKASLDSLSDRQANYIGLRRSRSQSR